MTKSNRQSTVVQADLPWGCQLIKRPDKWYDIVDSTGHWRWLGGLNRWDPTLPKNHTGTYDSPDKALRSFDGVSEAPPSYLRRSVYVQIWNNGRFLVLRRKDNRTWGLPGGGIEPGENSTIAAERELFEETGLKLDLSVGIVSTHQGSTCLIITEIKGPAPYIRLSDEHSEYEWHPDIRPMDVEFPDETETK